MTLTATLNAIGNLVVGEGVSASTAYPVVGVSRTAKRVGAAGTNTASYIEISWSLRCLAFAATSAAIAALNDTLETELCRRGEKVTLTEWATARVLPAGGITDGSMLGFPEMEISDIEADSFGITQAFTFRATTRIPIAAVDDLVEHDWTRTEDIATDGDTTIRQSGTVRVANGENARTYAQAEIIDPEEAAAEAAGEGFALKWTIGRDAAAVGYEFTRSPIGGDLPSGVLEAQVTDETKRSAEGRITRTISGWAKGTGAEAYVAGLKPTPTATEILTADRVSEPTVPDERINFSYEMLEGATDVNFPGLVVVSFDQSIRPVSGRRPIVPALYHTRVPILRLGQYRPWTYVERTTMEFVGSWLGADPDFSMDEDHLADEDGEFSERGGIRRASFTRVYMFDSQQTTPTPYALEGLD